ncbi:hypothetical protein ACLUEY_08185 [Vreelandella aquamarina]
MSEKSETVLPVIVLAEWETVLETSTLTQPQQALIRAAIQYALPPINQPQLLRAIEVYARDHEIMIPAELKDTVHYLDIPGTALTQYIVSYPLCHAMTDPKSPKAIADLGSPFQRAARQMLSGYFSDVDETAEGGLWYQDLQQTRDVLRELVNMGIRHPVLPPIDRGIVALVNQHLVASSASSNGLHQKCIRVVQLFAGINGTGAENAKKPGLRKREKTFRSSSLSRQHTQHAVIHEMNSHLRDVIQTQQRQRETACQRIDADVVDKNEFTQSYSLYRRPLSKKAVVHDLGLSSATYNLVERVNNHEASDDQLLTVTRQSPSTLTPQDDKTLVKKANRQAATDTLVSVSDIQRLTAAQIASLLSETWKTPTLWAFSLLLLSTGLPYKRLITLKRSNEMPTSRPATDENLLWNENTGYLWYMLLDGPSYNDGNLNNQVVLTLPAELNRKLIASAAGSDSDQPLLNAPRALKDYTRHHKKMTTGLLPTPARLTASAPLLIRSYAHDEIAQLALSGRFGVQYGAKAAYRQLSPGELNTLFSDVVTALNGHLPCINQNYEYMNDTASAGEATDDTHSDTAITTNDHASPSALMTAEEKFPNHPSDWITGSFLAAQPQQFVDWFKGLDTAITRSVTRFTSVMSPRKRSIRDACTICHLLACRAYLVLLLATGCRPHGPSTHYCLSNKKLWIADKDSPRYRESRVVPAVPALIKTLEQHALLLDSVTQWLKRRGGQINDLRADNQKIGYVHTHSKKDQQYVIYPIEHRYFQKTMENCLPHGIEDVASVRVRNVTRHSVATYLRAVLPAPVIDNLLGHTGSSVRPTTSESIALPYGRTSLTAAIERLLQQAQATTLNTSGAIHVFKE